jgi:hypothetical protein
MFDSYLVPADAPRLGLEEVRRAPGPPEKEERRKKNLTGRRRRPCIHDTRADAPIREAAYEARRMSKIIT